MARFRRPHRRLQVAECWIHVDGGGWIGERHCCGGIRRMRGDDRAEVGVFPAELATHSVGW